jgi:hypothetical protein
MGTRFALLKYRPVESYEAMSGVERHDYIVIIPITEKTFLSQR